VSVQTKIAKLLAYLSEGLPGFKPTAQTAAVWQDALQEYDEPTLVNAARQLVRSPKVILPTPGLIVQAIEGRTVNVPMHQVHPVGGRILDSRGAFVVEGWAEIQLAPGEDRPTHVTKERGELVRHYLPGKGVGGKNLLAAPSETPGAEATTKYLREKFPARPELLRPFLKEAKP